MTAADAAFATSIRKRLREEARLLSQPSPVRLALALLRTWGLVVLAVLLPVLVSGLLSHTFDPIEGVIAAENWSTVAAIVFAGLLAMIINAGQQHALLVIMHDATHFRLHASRRWNELIANWLCALPVGVVTSLYRRGHLMHHSFTNSPQDPYFVGMKDHVNFRTPMRKGLFYRLLAIDMVGGNLDEWADFVWPWLGWSFLFRKQKGNLLSRSEIIQFAGFWLLVGAVISICHLWYLFILLWLLPSMTFLLVFTRIRIAAEHTFEETGSELARTRHVHGQWWERELIAPMNINYHVAHHLFPSVPFYNLPKLQALLMQDAVFSSNACIYQSYLGMEKSVAAEILY